MYDLDMVNGAETNECDTCIKDCFDCNKNPHCGIDKEANAPLEMEECEMAYNDASFEGRFEGTEEI